jgi:hypothetical protein
LKIYKKIFGGERNSPYLCINKKKVMTKEQFGIKMIDITNEVNQVMNEFNPSKKKVLIKAFTLLLMKMNLTYSEQLDLSDILKEETIKNKNTQLK